MHPTKDWKTCKSPKQKTEEVPSPLLKSAGAKCEKLVLLFVNSLEPHKPQETRARININPGVG
jgi:hypothetical protein